VRISLFLFPFPIFFFKISEVRQRLRGSASPYRPSTYDGFGKDLFHHGTQQSGAPEQRGNSRSCRKALLCICASCLPSTSLKILMNIEVSRKQFRV
jgi:hypothetical protein